MHRSFLLPDPFNDNHETKKQNNIKQIETNQHTLIFNHLENLLRSTRPTSPMAHLLFALLPLRLLTDLQNTVNDWISAAPTSPVG